MIADLDGDGLLEIVAPVEPGPYQYQLTAIRISDGSVLPGWPVATEAGRPSLADADRDGTPEVIASGPDGVKIFSAAGELRADLPTPCECSGIQAVADVIGDGDLEIAVGTGRGLYLFDRLGYVLPGWPQGTDRYPEPITMADVDRDGVGDLAATADAAPHGGSGERLRFEPLPSPTTAHVEELTATIARRLMEQVAAVWEAEGRDYLGPALAAAALCEAFFNQRQLSFPPSTIRIPVRFLPSECPSLP